MREYRITKYNPANRIDGLYYAVDEWTSYSDIGKKFNGFELTREEYLKTENAHIDTCIDLIEMAKIQRIHIEQPEYYEDGIFFPASISDICEVRRAITACLREQCWLKLTAKDFFIHFGYDYNMYVGSTLPTVLVKQIAAKHGLYCELFKSPYAD